MIIGCDISHWNHPFQLKDFGEFQIHKLTEGRSYIDPKVMEWNDRNQTLRGIYHFMSNPSRWKEELDHFLNCINRLNTNIPTIPILDLEEAALTAVVIDHNMQEYIYNFLRTLRDKTGATPMLYTNTYGTNNLSKKIAGEFPLWIASYNKKFPVINMDWQTEQLKTFGCPYHIWQFTTMPFDLDLSVMNEKMWDEYSIK